MAADVPITNAGAESGADNTADGWTQNAWGTNAPVFTRPSTGAHSGASSLKVELSGYTNGDAKWMHAPVTVTGGKYYKFSDWYKSDADTAVAMFWQTAAQVGTDDGTWANIETGVEASSTWKQFEAGIDMPAGAVRAYFAHLIANNGYLQTDDYELEQLDSPPGLKRPLVTLTFDDSTPNLYNYVIPELDKLGYKSTQYVVTGATDVAVASGAREQIKDVHQRGHEIGSHTEYHPNLAMPGPTTVCKGTDAALLPVYSAPVRRRVSGRAAAEDRGRQLDGPVRRLVAVAEAGDDRFPDPGSGRDDAGSGAGRLQAQARELHRLRRADDRLPLRLL